MSTLSMLISVLVALASCNGLAAFQPCAQLTKNCVSRSKTGIQGSAIVGPRMTATARAYREETPRHFLLEEFCTHAGEVVDPYSTLKVSRDAEHIDVRKAYITLSKRYHPDSVRHRDILPGRCMDDVREEWERIKLSYEILSDRKTKMRYDRHAMIADPKGTMSRAAFEVVSKGIAGLGQGLFHVGSFAVRHITKEKVNKEQA